MPNDDKEEEDEDELRDLDDALLAHVAVRLDQVVHQVKCFIEVKDAYQFEVLSRYMILSQDKPNSTNQCYSIWHQKELQIRP